MNLKRIAYLLTAMTAASLVQGQILTENFSTLAPGTPITTDNSVFTLVRTLDEPARIEAVTSTMRGSRSMMLQSTGSNTIASYVGVGVNALPSSNVFSLSLDIKSENWRTNHGLIIAMGSSTDENGFYGSSGTLSSANIYSESLFAIRLMGNSNVGANPNSAKLQTIGASSWVDQNANVIGNDAATNFHFVVNGSDVALTVGDVTLLSKAIGIWLNGEFLSSYAIGGNASADALRIFTHGRGGSYTTSLDVEIGDIKLWDGAVSPIPESKTYALIFAGIASACLLLFRRKGIAARG